MEEKQTVKTLAGYPVGFWICSVTEVFERIAYYLGRSLILVFVATAVANGGLGLSDAVGAKMQANLTAFSYLVPLIFGVVVDRFIGARYTTPVGMVIAGVGYFMGSLAKGVGGVYAMIFFVSLGLGMFKTGPMVGRIITDKSQADPAFSILYSVSNFGSFIGPLIAGVLYQDVFAKNGVLGFVGCFRLAAIVMVVGAVFFVFGWQFMGDAGKRPFKEEKTAEELEKEAQEKAANKEARKQPLTAIEKKRIAAIILVTAFSAVFWIFWYLAYLPVYYHWEENLNWNVLGYNVPVTWFDAFNALFCVAAGPLMAKLWTYLAERPQGDMSLFRKTGIGLGFLGLGYVYFALIDLLRGSGKPSALLLLIFLVFLTLGEMFFSPLGSSFISKYAPGRYFGLLMSCWGFGLFVGAKCYGYVYEFAFGGNFSFVAACCGVAVVAFAVAAALFILDKRLSSLIDEENN